MIGAIVKSFAKFLESKKHPLLGPNIKGLSFEGMWLKGSSRLWIGFQIFVNVVTFLFVVSQFMEVFCLRKDLNKLLRNLSVTTLSVTCYTKCMVFLFRLDKWSDLFHSISNEEIRAIQSGDEKTLKSMNEYTKYSRLVTYVYWILCFITNFALLIAPVFKLFSSSNFREEASQGIIPYPEMLSSWFPFDNNRMPGYLFACFVHVSMASKGAVITATYDTNAVAIMVFLKGQMLILKEKCSNIFEDCKSREDALLRIKECHRHHNFLMRTYRSFNGLLSPIMFLYVLVCSITICFSVVQFKSPDATPSQKMFVVEYIIALVVQLFLFCWHSNEVLLESKSLSDGVYFSDWWKTDKTLQKQVLLLAGKLNRNVIFHAGPYTTLTIPTFIDILKGSYSFFTLFSQMQE